MKIKDSIFVNHSSRTAKGQAVAPVYTDQQRVRIVFIFSFLCGLSGLVYETFWVRALGLTLGSTAQATATVVAVFLGGLALGALIGGAIAERKRSALLLIYGGLEIAVGITALCSSHLLSPASSFYVWLYHLVPESAVPLTRAFTAVLVLLPPTILMGATLPVLVGFLETHRQATRLFNALYGLNTLGATVGCLLACFLGFTYIGLQATVLCAAAVNLVVGCFSISLSRHQCVKSGFEQRSVKGKQDSGGTQPVTGTQPGPFSPTLGTVSFLVGFTAISYEILWVRILRLFLTSLTYSFTIVITMFLLGLAVGSFIAGNYWLRRSSAFKTRPYLAFSLLQYAAALAAAASMSLVISSSTLYATLRNTILAGATLSGAADHLLFMIVVSAFAVFIPTSLIGTLFPMIGRLVISRYGQAARNIGSIYALNTAGCVAGSLVCGLVLIPTIGSFNALTLTIVLSLLTGLIVSLQSEQVGRVAKILLVSFPLLVAASYKTVHFMPGYSDGEMLVASGEDTTGIMQVISNPSNKELRLVFNGSCLASTAPSCRRYMRLSASLPILLHKHPEHVLVGCFGTGTTCGEAALHSEVKQVDVVELSSLVMHTAPLFHKANNDALNNSKVKVTLSDVRNFLLTTDRRYDVVTFEPPPPTEANVVNLYTEEFYRLLSSHLNDDGIVCQWIPAHQTSTQLWKMMVATARSVFPYISVWMPNNKEAILIASKQPVNPDFVQMQQRIDASPRLKASLHEVGLDSPMALLSTFVGSGAALDTYIKDSLPITDDLPRLEFFLPYAGQPDGELDLEAMARADLLQLVMTSRHQKGFDEKEFWRQWMAVHDLRAIETAADAAQADARIDDAVRLLPGSNWLQYVATHRQHFHPFADSSWVHGP